LLANDAMAPVAQTTNRSVRGKFRPIGAGLSPRPMIAKI